MTGRGGRRSSGLERVGSLLRKVLRSRGVADEVERASAVPEWGERVGPEIDRVSEPTGFDGSTLFVEVDSSAWLMELRMMERHILTRLNEGRARGKFEKIVFRLAQDR